MKKGFAFVIIALLSAAAGAVLALLALKKHSECMDDDYELTDSVFFEDDEDADDYDDYTCVCSEPEDAMTDEPMLDTPASFGVNTTPTTDEE